MKRTFGMKSITKRIPLKTAPPKKREDASKMKEIHSHLTKKGTKAKGTEIAHARPKGMIWREKGIAAAKWRRSTRLGSVCCASSQLMILKGGDCGRSRQMKGTKGTWQIETGGHFHALPFDSLGSFSVSFASIKRAAASDSFRCRQSRQEHLGDASSTTSDTRSRDSEF